MGDRLAEEVRLASDRLPEDSGSLSDARLHLTKAAEFLEAGNERIGAGYLLQAVRSLLDALRAKGELF